MLRSRNGKLWKGQSRTFYLRLRNPAGISNRPGRMNCICNRAVISIHFAYCAVKTTTNNLLCIIFGFPRDTDVLTATVFCFKFRSTVKHPMYSILRFNPMFLLRGKQEKHPLNVLRCVCGCCRPLPVLIYPH